MPKLPKKDEITFRWLIDHLPLSWWITIIVAATSLLSAGIGIGRLSFQSLDSDIKEKLAVRDKLQTDVQELSSKKESLKSEIIRLQVDRDVEKMAPDQVREELKKWTRD